MVIAVKAELVFSQGQVEVRLHEPDCINLARRFVSKTNFKKGDIERMVYFFMNPEEFRSVEEIIGLTDFKESVLSYMYEKGLQRNATGMQSVDIIKEIIQEHFP